MESRIGDIIAEAAIHAKAIGARLGRVEALVTERRQDEQDRLLRSRRLTFLRKCADKLEEAEKMTRGRRPTWRVGEWDPVKICIDNCLGLTDVLIMSV